MIQPLALLLAVAAHGDVPSHPAKSTFPAVVRPALVHADTAARLSPMHAHANELSFIGRYSEARTVYHSLIAFMDSAATFPGEAMWSLATMEYGLHRELRAAEVLDELAEAAVRYGRPEWQARALLEAGILYQNNGRQDLSVLRAKALKPLLTSPSIAPSERAQMAERVAMKK